MKNELSSFKVKKGAGMIALSYLPTILIISNILCFFIVISLSIYDQNILSHKIFTIILIILFLSMISILPVIFFLYGYFNKKLRKKYLEKQRLDNVKIDKK